MKALTTCSDLCRVCALWRVSSDRSTTDDRPRLSHDTRLTRRRDLRATVIRYGRSRSFARTDVTTGLSMLSYVPAQACSGARPGPVRVGRGWARGRPACRWRRRPRVVAFGCRVWRKGKSALATAAPGRSWTVTPHGALPPAAYSACYISSPRDR